MKKKRSAALDAVEGRLSFMEDLLRRQAESLKTADEALAAVIKAPCPELLAASGAANARALGCAHAVADLALINLTKIRELLG